MVEAFWLNKYVDAIKPKGSKKPAKKLNENETKYGAWFACESFLFLMRM